MALSHRARYAAAGRALTERRKTLYYKAGKYYPFQFVPTGYFGRWVNIRTIQVISNSPPI